MVSNWKPTGRASSVPAGLGWGALASVGLTGVLSLLLGKLLQSELLGWDGAGYWIMAMVLISAFWGALISAACIKRQRILVCGLAGLVYFGFLLSLTALFFGGQFEGVGVTAALVFGGCGTAGLLGMRENRGGKKGKRRKRYR